jgi:AcrR family transcriptional regulator
MVMTIQSTPNTTQHERGNTERRPRRTQRERRDETRAKLLDATIECLLDVGYAGTSTRLVSERAGVSHGALVHHFRYRVDLVGAAIEELARRRVHEFTEQLEGLPADGTEQIELLLDRLWADFSSGLFTVFVKVWVAAADDPELYGRLVPIEREIARRIGELVDAQGIGLLDAPSRERRLRVTLDALRGAALRKSFEPRDRPGRDPWPELRQTLCELLLPDSRSVPPT